MKRTLTSKINVIAALSVFAMFAEAQCYNLQSGSACGGPSTPASCKNSCVSTSYSINGANMTCCTTDENGCGSTVCNSSSVTIWKYVTDYTQIVGSEGGCIGCGWPTTDQPMQNVGNCEQDTVDGDECGDCYE